MNKLKHKKYLRINWEERTLEVCGKGEVEDYLEENLEAALEDTDKEEVEEVTEQYSWTDNSIDGGGGKVKEIFLDNEIDMDTSFVNLG